MMKPLALGIAVVLLLGGRLPERLGVGIATVSVEPGVRIALFETPGATEPLEHVGFVWDAPHSTIRLSEESPVWLRPDLFSPDYFLFTVRVLTVTDTALEVVVDVESGRTLWMRTHPAVVYKPWAQYLVEDVTGFDRLNAETNPLRASPGPDAPGIPYASQDGWDCLAVAEVRGDWLRVRRSDLCYSEDVPPVDGWIRWRDGETLLISYGLIC